MCLTNKQLPNRTIGYTKFVLFKKIPILFIKFPKFKFFSYSINSFKVFIIIIQTFHILKTKPLCLKDREEFIPSRQSINHHVVLTFFILDDKGKTFNKFNPPGLVFVQFHLSLQVFKGLMSVWMTNSFGQRCNVAMFVKPSPKHKAPSHRLDTSRRNL